MGKTLGDDLRRKLLFAYDQGEGTLEDLASRFLVSVGWAKKISAARNRTGQAERVPHKPGRCLLYTSFRRMEVKASIRNDNNKLVSRATIRVGLHG